MSAFAQIYWGGRTYHFKEGNKPQFTARSFDTKKTLQLTLSQEPNHLNTVYELLGENPIKNDEKHTYLVKANQIIDQLEKNELEKLVFSKRKILSGKLDLEKSFKNLVKAHPKACVFCFFDGKELWMGATPETLINKTPQHFETMALAASKPLSDQSPWSEKEEKEHLSVVKDILKKLKPYHIQKSEPYEKIAGAVKHLQTKIQILDHAKTSEILSKLHPTTAVCGHPQNKALSSISKIESSPRSYYTGYFGIELEDLHHYWVNLRSFQVFNSGICLYLGGGFVEGSNAEKEWEETEWKAQSLIPFLHFL